MRLIRMIQMEKKFLATVCALTHLESMFSDIGPLLNWNRFRMICTQTERSSAAYGVSRIRSMYHLFFSESNAIISLITVSLRRLSNIGVNGVKCVAAFGWCSLTIRRTPVSHFSHWKRIQNDFNLPIYAKKVRFLTSEPNLSSKPTTCEIHFFH